MSDAHPHEHVVDPNEAPPHPTEAHSDQTRAERFGRTARGILLPLLALLSAFIVGGLIIILTDAELIGMWTSDPIGAIGASWSAVASSYGALFRGSIGDPGELFSAITTLDLDALREAFDPLSETLVSTTPLIFTGLSVALAFRAGLFNIGAEGQLYVGALLAAIVGFSVTGLPGFIHLPLALLAGFVGGALWGFIPGILKARTGAHEVITTIMLNYIAGLFLTWLILQPGVQDPGRTDAISKTVDSSAQLASFGGALRVNLGIVLAVLVTAGVAWLLNRSAFGFELRAVGANPAAARTAGISVARTYTLLMVVAGGLAGLGGATQVLGTAHALTPAVAGNIGFDGLLVALLGRNRPWGTLLAAVLFGALRAGGNRMQSFSGISLELVTVLQALIVIFIAAPALVKAIFHLRAARAARLGTSMAKGW